jgi:hypothetical protein
MQYGMEYGYRVFFILALCTIVSAGSAGCLSSVFGPAPSYNQPAAVVPSPTTAPSTGISDLALQPTDLPSDYILLDRSLIAYGGISQLDRDLGWRQGYQVSFYRLDKKHDDMTDVSQQISMYTPENINEVFRIKRDALMPAGDNTSGYQIPFPIIGDQSVAWRDSVVGPNGDITSYSVIFVKKNVFEQMHMEGTTTDYEVLKTIAQTAAGRIQ